MSHPALAIRSATRAGRQRLGRVERRRHQGSRHDRAGAALLVTWLVLGSYSLWQALRVAPFRFSDSADYEAVARHGWFSTGLWAGRRPPLLPILWKLIGTTTGFEIFQTLVALACWGYLAATVVGIMRTPLARFAAGVSILGFAASPPVVLWDRSVLTESLAISLIVVSMALLVRCTRTFDAGYVAAFVLVALLMALLRDEGAVEVALSGIAVVVTGVIVRRGEGAGASRALLPRLGLALCAVAAVAEGLALGSGRNATNIDNLYAVRVFPYPARVAWFEQRGMPEEREVERIRPAAGATPGFASHVPVPFDTPPFRALRVWIGAHGAQDYGEWLLAHPGFILTAPLAARQEAAYEDGSLTLYDGPRRPPMSGQLLTGISYPPWQAEVLLGTVALWLAVERRRWRSVPLLSMAAAAVLGLVFMFVAWHADGYETQRHMLEGNVRFRLSVLIALILVVPTRTGFDDDDRNPRVVGHHVRSGAAGEAHRRRPIVC